MDDVKKVTIDVRNVIKRYGDFTALQKISMSISDNEFHSWFWAYQKKTVGY